MTETPSLHARSRVPDTLDLTGTWRAAVADATLEREFARPSFDDRGFEPIDVPGHWRSCSAFAESDGPLLYRRRFDTTPPAAERRRWLELDGCFYYGDVWLDGAYLGDTHGYFAPHAFDVTAALATERGHVLGVEVSCPPQTDRTHKRLLTGVFSHWDVLDRTWNPGGLWRPVRIRETGPVRIARARVLCTEARPDLGRLSIDVTLDASTELERDARVTLVTSVHGSDVDVEQERAETVAAGANHLRWTVEVDDPPLWWPRRLGVQPLVDVDIVVEVHGRPSDAVSRRTAFREVTVDDWVFRVNGERLFVLGSNHGPTRMALAEATPEELHRDVELAVQANLDLLRLHAHVTRPELYAAADEAGLLLWQDFPLQWGYARGLRKEASRQARAMVDELGHHPSIALWCTHNEPLAIDTQPGEPMDAGAIGKFFASMMLPTWNKDVLDRGVTRTVRRADPTRFCNRHSGIWPGIASGGTDCHWYFGWYHGSMDGLAPALARWPRTARFVSEFGAQAVPEAHDFMHPERWPDLDWDELLAHHACQKLLFDRTVPPAGHDTLAAWATATREYQAALIQLQVEDLRRVRYAPAGGFCHFCFADAHPAVTWSVLDHQRNPKPGFEALREACRPVLPMLEPRSGSVHVVNETREPLVGAVVTAHVGRARRRWQGNIPADGIAFVGRIAVDDSGRAEGALLHLEHSRVGPVDNRYDPLLLQATRPGPPLPS